MSGGEISEAFLLTLFPDRRDRIADWLKVLHQEECRTFADMLPFGDAEWAALSLPLAVKTRLRQAVVSTAAPPVATPVVATAAPAAAVSVRVGGVLVPPPATAASSAATTTTAAVPEPAAIVATLPSAIFTDPTLSVVASVDATTVAAAAASPTAVVMEPITQLDCIVLDISSSMKSRSVVDPLQSREDVSKVVFHLMVDAILSLEMHHAVSLIAFGKNITTPKELTVAYERFHDELGRLDANENSTRLYDSIDAACHKLIHARDVARAVDGRALAPDVALRVFVLTDGDDNASTKRPWEVVKLMNDARVTLDAFPLGPPNAVLQAMAAATHGVCVTVVSLEQTTHVFERESLLHVASRDAPSTRPAVRCEKDLAKFTSKGSVVTDTGVSKAVRTATTSQSFTGEAALSRASAAAAATAPTAAGAGSSSTGAAGALEPACVRRVQKEFRDLLQFDPDTVIPFIAGETLATWKVILRAPPSATLYSQSYFVLLVQFPPQYPMVPPKIRFLTPVYHCNISSDGVMCMDVLKSAWSPALTISKVLQAIGVLLTSPNPDDPLDAFKGTMFINDRPRYERECRVYTATHGFATKEAAMAAFSLDGGAPSLSTSSAPLPVAAAAAVVPISVRVGSLGRPGPAGENQDAA